MKILSIGELLMRLTVPNNLRFSQSDSFRIDVGGSEANVAIALAQLGWGSCMLSALPDNEIGDRVYAELAQFNVDTKHIARVGERLGVYYLEEGRAIRSSRIVYDRANSSINDLTPEMIDWDQLFEDVSHLHWSGITPALSQNAADVCLKAVKLAADKDITISCDLHYRKNLWTYGKRPVEVIPGLIENSSIVLGDPSTIQVLTGLKMPSSEIANIDSSDQLIPDYRNLMSKFPRINYVSMLLRNIFSANHHKLQAILVTKEEAFESSSLNIDNIVDRIGGGDAFMAGLIYSLSHFDDKTQSLEFALALSALKHTIQGDFFRGKLSDVEQIMNADATPLGKIIR